MAKVALQLCVCKTQFILVLLFIIFCIIFHTNNCKTTFAPPCIFILRQPTADVVFLSYSYIEEKLQVNAMSLCCLFSKRRWNSGETKAEKGKNMSML